MEFFQCVKCTERFDIPDIQSHLLSLEQDASCKCGEPISEVKLFSTFNTDWIKEIYNPHRCKVFFKQYSIPSDEDIEYIVARKQEQKLEKQREEILSVIKRYNATLKTSRYDKSIDKKDIKAKISQSVKIYKELFSESIEISEIPVVNIAKCSAVDCKGFINRNSACEECGEKFCKKCGEMENPGPHVCDEGNVKSFSCIMKETKPCPRCGIRIFRTSGCDSMTCSRCKTDFNWKSLKISYQWRVFPTYVMGYKIINMFLENEFNINQDDIFFSFAKENEIQRAKIKYLIGEINQETFEKRIFNQIMRCKFLIMKKKIGKDIKLSCIKIFQELGILNINNEYIIMKNLNEILFGKNTDLKELYLAFNYKVKFIELSLDGQEYELSKERV